MQRPIRLAFQTLHQQLDHLEALLKDYAADSNAITYPPDLAVLKWRIARLRRQADQLEQEAEQAAALRAECEALAADFAALDAGYKVIPALKRRAEGMLAEAKSLGAKPGPARSAPCSMTCAPPASTEDRQDFAARDDGDIHWIIIHHAPEAVELDARTPGGGAIAAPTAALCHFYIAADGATYQTQDLTALIEHIGLHGVDATSIAVALEGRFDADTPGEAQMNALADLVTWLMDALRSGCRCDPRRVGSQTQ